MAVTVNVLPRDVEITKPVHIVISNNSSPRPAIWQSLKDLTFSKFPDLVENYGKSVLRARVSTKIEQNLKIVANL